ncbi:MAG: hypothetical protein ACXWW4_17600 [Candidatus Binatia bacterium]
MNQTMTNPGRAKAAKRGRFGALLAAAVILYIAAIMVFIVVY